MPCEKCNNKTYHIKRPFICSFPKYLTITFQRYHPRLKTKNTSSIKFSTSNIDFSQFTDIDLCTQKGSYDLIGISNHSGSLNFGHYFAYCRDSVGDWYECNDSFVSKANCISNQGINSSNSAYVLIYERKN